MSRTEKGGVEQPFSDWPHTEFIKDEGGGWLHITGKYVSPSWWWSRGNPIVLMFVWLFIAPWSCVALNEGSIKNIPVEEAIAFPAIWAVVLFVAAAVAEYFGRRRRLDVRLSREFVGIGAKNYARSMPHQYAMEDHEKAFEEEGAERSTGDRSRVYRDAMQVVMRYGEKRIPVADFRRGDVRKAEALLVRLQMLDKGLEEMLGTAGQGDKGAAPGERDGFGKPPPIR